MIVFVLIPFDCALLQKKDKRKNKEKTIHFVFQVATNSSGDHFLLYCDRVSSLALALNDVTYTHTYTQKLTLFSVFSYAMHIF